MFKVVKVKTKVTPEREYSKDGKVIWASVINSLCESDERNDILLHYIMYFVSMKMMILTHRVNHGLLLYNVLKKLGVSCDYMCGVKKTYSNSRVLIGTPGKIGTGFDEKNNCMNYDGVRINCLFLVGSIKSTILLKQCIGRVFRSSNPIIFETSQV